MCFGNVQFSHYEWPNTWHRWVSRATVVWPQSADQIGTAMPQPGKVPTTISCRPKRGSKGQCSQFARSEQGQYLVQMASFTVNKWSNLGRSHSVTFRVSLCSKNVESFFFCPVYDSQCVAMSRKMMHSDIVTAIWIVQYQSTVLFQLFSSENGLHGPNWSLFS